MAYVIAEPCYTTKDKACVPACPVDCIYEGPKMLYIHPEEWKDGQFTAPHGATWDSKGDLYVEDWNKTGRINKMKRVKA